MKSTADISVIIPAYNREATLQRTLESVAAQRVLPREVIVVDNNSIDGTRDVAEQFALSHDTLNIKVTSCTKSGASAARNAGLAEAEGQWVSFFDSDDVMLPDLLATYAGYTAGEYDIIGVKLDYRFLSGRSRISNLPHSRYVAQQIMHTTLGSNNFIVRRSVVQSIGGWNDKLPCWNDWEIATRLLLEVPESRVKYLNQYPALAVHISQAKSLTGIGYADKVDMCLKSVSSVEAAVKSYHRIDEAKLMLLLQYKRIMLAAQCNRERSPRAGKLRDAVVDTMPNEALRGTFRWIYYHISLGLPGGSRIADFVIRLLV